MDDFGKEEAEERAAEKPVPLQDQPQACAEAIPSPAEAVESASSASEAMRTPVKKPRLLTAGVAPAQPPAGSAVKA
eukprot:2082461-Lingulodinium_polyedra.AAC.1